MKKYLPILLMCNAVGIEAQTLPGKDAAPLQGAVEQGLRRPVAFQQEEVRTFTVKDRLTHHQVPGISFALIEDGKIAWAQGYGKLSASSNDAITTHTVFQAASIAKPVTAFAVMRMKDQGQININTAISHYLTSLTLPQGEQTADKAVTFKNLLDHSAGLTGGGYVGYEKGTEIPSDIQTFQGISPATSQASVVESTPGSVVRYAGAGYTLAEIALTDKFKQPFAQLMDTWVLSPLGMTNSSFAIDYPEQAGKQIALGHEASGKTISGGWRIHPEQAAAGLWSTPTDLAKLAIETSKAFQGSSKVLSQASAVAMLTPVFPKQDLSGQFGGQPAMTFIVDGTGEQFMFQHGGGNVGYRCFLLMYPNTGKGAVFMTNSDAGYSVGMEMLRAAAAAYHWPDFKGKSYHRRKVDPKQQALLTGDYPFASGWQVQVMPVTQADGIAVKFPNGDIYPLSAVQGEHAYVHEDSGVEIRFDLKNGQTTLHLYQQTASKKR